MDVAAREHKATENRPSQATLAGVGTFELLMPRRYCRLL